MRREIHLQRLYMYKRGAHTYSTGRHEKRLL